MAEFTIDLGGLGASLGKMLDRVDDAVGMAVELGVMSIVNEARALAPSGSTGQLKNSIRSGGVSGAFSRGDMHAEIVADAPHAAALEYGSGLYGERRAKYPIKPKNKRYLRWAVPGGIGAGGAAGAGFAFSKGVMHPGVKPVRFLERAVEAKIGVLEREVAAAIEEAIVGG